MELTGKIYDVNSFLESYQLISKYRWHVVALYGQTKMTVWNIYLLETGPLLFRAVINDFTSIGQWCPPHAGTQQHSTNPTWHSYWLVQPWGKLNRGTMDPSSLGIGLDQTSGPTSEFFATILRYTLFRWVQHNLFGYVGRLVKNIGKISP
jgi:hypothetical protein